MPSMSDPTDPTDPTDQSKNSWARLRILVQAHLSQQQPLKNFRVFSCFFVVKSEIGQ